MPRDTGANGTALDAAYRGDGLRGWKEGASRTYFLYDGINVVCELDADGDVIAASTFGAAGLLSRGAVQYQFDPLGDAVHLLDGDGDVTANRFFDAWGNELTSGTFNPRGYRARYGYYTDEETGLVALAYRYYGPGVGRFLNRDPIGYEGGVNLLSYTQSRAVSDIDADGLSPAVVIGLVGAVVTFVGEVCRQLAQVRKCGTPLDIRAAALGSFLPWLTATWLALGIGTIGSATQAGQILIEGIIGTGTTGGGSELTGDGFGYVAGQALVGFVTGLGAAFAEGIATAIGGVSIAAVLALVAAAGLAIACSIGWTRGSQQPCGC